MPDMKCKEWQILHRETDQKVMRCRLKCVNAVETLERDRRSGMFWKISAGPEKRRRRL